MLRVLREFGLTLAALAVLLSAVHRPAEAVLRISAFNIQVFGVSKMEDQAVVDILIQTIMRNDMVFIQEIRDASETAIFDLLNQVNEASASDPYVLDLSIRLGTTSSKEQYAFMYRPSSMTLVDTYQFPQESGLFERPPYVGRFTTSESGIGEFGFMGIHVKPDDADCEIDRLVDTYDEIVGLWGLEDIVIGGDLNAGCNYVCDSCWDDIRLRTEDRFLWTIGDEVDTTVSNTECPYDRLVLAGSSLQSAYVEGSAIPFLFDDEYGLTQEEALDVSDHYPVDMDLA